jgi:hypothetical protein
MKNKGCCRLCMPQMAANLQLLYSGSQKQELAMQTVYTRYTLAERMVLSLITVVSWPVERFFAWLRHKATADLVPSANRR